MRSSALAFGAILSACGVGGAAFAQTAPQVPKVQSQRDIKLEARVSAVYDSNSARTGKVLAQGACKVFPDKLEGAPTYDELLANHSRVAHFECFRYQNGVQLPGGKPRKWRRGLR